jgi:hypothetical protein
MGTVPRELARVGLVHHGRAQCPRLQLLQFNHACDATARFRLRQLGGLDGGKGDLLTLLRGEQREISQQIRRSDTSLSAGGAGALPQNNFYIYAAGGVCFATG